jgi:phospholipid transport system substrate-binding protein
VSRLARVVFLAALFWPVAATAQVAEPEELVRDATDQVLEILRDNTERIKSDPAYVYGVVGDVVLPHFDFEEMTRLALGRHWRDANASQQAALVEQFKTLLVRTYSKALQQYSDQTVQFLPTRGDPASGDVTVRTEIEQQGGFPIPVSYSLYRVGDDWKVYDVVIDGVSLVTNYRSSFSQKIRQDGIKGLIDQLRARNRDGE